MHLLCHTVAGQKNRRCVLPLQPRGEKIHLPMLRFRVLVKSICKISTPRFIWCILVVLFFLLIYLLSISFSFLGPTCLLCEFFNFISAESPAPVSAYDKIWPPWAMAPPHCFKFNTPLYLRYMYTVYVTYTVFYVTKFRICSMSAPSRQR